MKGGKNLLVLIVVLLLSFSMVATAQAAKEADDDEETSNAISTPLRIGVSIWSKYELTNETEKSIKDAVEQLIEERINVEKLGGIAVDCFILKREGGWYIIYARIFGKPLPGSPEASEGKAKTWEATLKYNIVEGFYNVTSFSEVDSFLVQEDIRQKAMTICERDEEVRAFITENVENNLTLQATWINKDDEIVRLVYAAAQLLNETHALYKGLTAYIDVDAEEILCMQMHQGVWYAPGLRGSLATPPDIEELIKTVETGTSITTTNTTTSSHPAEHCYYLGALLATAVIGALIAIRKAKR